MMNPPQVDARREGVSAASRTAADGRDCVDSSLLFRGARELIIDHGGNAYHLRITRNDKLILTK